MSYKENDLVMCRVLDIVKTTVFVETLDGIKGSMVLSEIAPGRIRNLREYVVPNKIIVCKVLDVKDGHLFLSLRRVKDKEKKEFMENYKKEKMFASLIKQITGENSEKIIEKIKQKYSITEFVEKSREDKKIIEDYFDKKYVAELENVLKEKGKKERELKVEFVLRCKRPDGILVIKKILGNIEGTTYLGNSSFMIKRKAIDIKKLDMEITQAIENIENQAKKEKCEFQLKTHK